MRLSFFTFGKFFFIKEVISSEGFVLLPFVFASLSAHASTKWASNVKPFFAQPLFLYSPSRFSVKTCLAASKSSSASFTEATPIMHASAFTFRNT